MCSLVRAYDQALLAMWAVLICASAVTAWSQAVFTVANPADAGPGSLRQALLDANSSPGKDTVVFAIPGPGVHTIALTAALPQVTDPVVIDATTQPGYAGQPLVELDGTRAGSSANGLLLLAGSSTIRGLAISRFGGDGIHIQGPGANTIQANFLGTDPTGRLARGNGAGGVTIYLSSGNQIGGRHPGEANLLSGGNLSGIYIIGSASASNLVEGNLIGTDITGTARLGNQLNGIVISDASSNLIGGAVAGAANLISGNGQSGIYIMGQTASGNTILGNQIGAGLAGSSSLSNVMDGVTINGAPSNVIGGTDSLAGNLISGNAQCGVLIAGSVSSYTQILGNFIGVDRSGANALGNGSDGVNVSGGIGTQIGGLVAGARNVISGNQLNGVAFTGSASNNWVMGNLIGTDVAGTRAVSNRLSGILLAQSGGNTIGGATAGVGNVISGNTGGNGVYLAGTNASGNVIQGNLIGTDVTGKLALGNLNGVGITNAPANLIGGLDEPARNIISASAESGIYVAGSLATGNQIQGNYIGTDITGSAALANQLGGIYLYGAPTNLIGGTATGAGNLISGNLADGLSIGDPGTVGNVVQGNFIGTQADGVSPLGNQWHNVEFLNSASNNIVGGVAAGAGNRIAFAQTTRYAGVRIRDGCAGNLVRGNAIFSNAGLGIDLGTNGVNPNHAGDVPGGANRLQNYPVLSSASGRYLTTIQGTLNSDAKRTYTLDFYANTAKDPTGYGQGAFWIGWTTVTTDAAGNASFHCALTNAVAVTGFISATATDPDNNTSEFCLCVPNQVGPIVDSDGDGMPDDYELAWGFNPNWAGDASLDADGDGMTNLQEYLAGTNPRDAASVLRLQQSMPGGGQLLLTFPTVVGKTYRVEWSASLSSGWTPLVANLAGNGFALRVNDQLIVGSGSRFYWVFCQ